MVMILDALKKQGSARRRFHKPDIDQIPADKYERLEVRDYDYDTGDQATWHAEFTARELYTNLPAASRIEPDYMVWRKTWALLGGMTIFLLGYVGLVTAIGPLYSIFPAVIWGCFGGAIGWWNGAKLCMTPPFWVARRLWVDGVPFMQPIVHTGLRGEPTVIKLPATPMNGRKNGRKPPEEEGEENIQGPPRLGGPEEVQSRLQVAGFDAIPPGVYVPVVWRSTTLFQDLQMVEERLDMRMPPDRWQAVKIGGMIVLAGLMVMGLIFVMAVTSNNG